MIREIPLHQRELKGNGGATFDFELETTVENGEKTLNSRNQDLKASFLLNLKYWNNQTQFLATNNFESSYYRNIIDMGIEAVPLILSEIKEKPSFLVHALDEILPGVVEYGEGYIPVEKACNIWISILSQIEQS